MTALSRYQRLECPGHWRESPAHAAREVIVSFGDASLILSDLKSNVALTHWSLPAAERLNPGTMPAIFSPDPRGQEVLEIAEPAMVEAIDQVRRAIEAQRPKAGWLRGPLLAAGLVAFALAAMFLLPDVLIRHTANALPAPTRADISDKVLQDLGRLTGAACHTPAGDRALAKLSARLGGREGGIVILPRGFDTTAHLPDGRILLQRSLLDADRDPEVAIGFILAEEQRGAAHDAMQGLLHYAGLPATLRLLATGVLPESAVRGYAETMLTAALPPLDDEALLARFAALGVPSTPFAYALDPSGATTLSLIEGDPFRNRAAPPALVPDADWIGLQGSAPDKAG